MEMLTVKHGGASIQLPHDVVVSNWLASIQANEISSVSCLASLSIPAIGEYWKGQGGVYAGVMRGEAGQCDRHIIVPPDVLKLKGAWGEYGKLIAGADHERYGMPNTVAMAESGSEIAKAILSMEHEGHNDYYLMARYEGALAYANVPELFEKEWHWTSTQRSAHGAFIQGFSDGNQHCYYKDFSYGVRPVRSFVI